MTRQSTPPSLAPKTAQRTSLGHRLQRALTGGPNRRSPGLHPSPGGAASLPSFLNRRLALPILAILALLAASLLFLLPSSPLQAQDDGTIEYAEKGTGPVATYTASDPEGASVRWTLGGVDAGDFTIEDGVLRFAKTPNYEEAADYNMDNTYVVNVQATDETRRTETETVTVNVTNVDEDGTVELSALRPQSATAFTASITDLDGAVTNAKWQWSKSSSKNGAYSPIDKATSATYTPVDDYIDYYLRATVTYTDPEGEGKTAKMESDFPVQAVRGSNMPPKFAADQDPNRSGTQADATRSVAENTEAGSTVGDPVTADPKDGDVLTYTLWDAGGTTQTGASANFDIDRATGQIMTKVKSALDAEGSGTEHDNEGNAYVLYLVEVRATDPAGIPGTNPAVTANSAVVKVVIIVTDVNDAPVVTAGTTTPPTFAEVLGAITTVLESYTATDADDNPTTLSLGGADGSKFEIDLNNGGLTFKKKPDYEKPTDADMDNVYEVTVQASDGKLTGTLKVKVTVTNEEEPGVVTLDKVTPVEGIPVTATLKDADGGISKLTWAWVVSGATVSTSDVYTPKAGDEGNTLTVTASYFDGQSAPIDITNNANAKTAEVTSVNVERDTRNKAPVFGDEDPDTDGVQNSAATRKVEEGTTGTVGAPVAATDTKAAGTPEALQYSLSGTDAGSFTISSASGSEGQITVGSGTKLDYEGKRTYMVTVTATDPLGASSSIPVTIEVTNVDETPEISGDDTISYPEKGTGPVATYTASDPEGASVRWTLGGVDAGNFTIEDGVLRFAKTPNYEEAADYNMDNTYVVDVQATDETRRTETETVTVNVTNVDEDGTVELSALRPQSATAFTASITDLDGAVTNAKWQWSKSSSKNGAYSPIDKATSATYTPVDDYIDYYLRATVTYTDPEGEGKTAKMESDFPVQAVRGSNMPPKFAADQDPNRSGTQADATRSVAENTEAGSTVGDPVTADPKDGDVLTYTLWDVGGTTQTGASANFDIDGATGQIMTKVKSALDAEGSGTEHDNEGNAYVLYLVEVRATDPAGIPGANPAVTANSAVVKVVIIVTDVNDAPVVTAGTTTPPTFAEVLGAITTVLESYTATDADDNPTTLSLGGADGSKFEIDLNNGGLTFKKKPDYEKPTDADMDNVYEVTVQASDGKLTGTLKVKVTVTNEEEPGVVTLDKVTPVEGIPVTATLKDADGGISKLTWAWVVSGATVSTSDAYTPKAGDEGNTLTVTASYFDGQSAPIDITNNANAKTAEVTSVNVERDTRNKAPVFGDEDPDTDGVQNSAATRKVEEGTTGTVGAPVAATDTKAVGTPEALQYSLSGTDAGSFTISSASGSEGQITIESGTKLDYEGKRTYMVTVTATDPLGASSSIPVTIEVTNVDETPEIMRAPGANVAPEFADSEDGARSVAENTVAGKDIGNPVAASDANGGALTYALIGTDAASFDIISATGQLQTKAALDYETKDSYTVTVTASDSGGLSDSIDVTITVTDVNEAPVAPTVANQTATKDTAFSYTVPAFTDPEGGTITYTATLSDDSALPGWLSFNASTRELSGTPLEADTPASLTIEVSATDEGSPSASAQVTFTLTVGEEAPTTLLVRYDDSKDGWIQLKEARVAVGDYFGPSKGVKLSLADTRKVVGLYFEYKNRP